MAHLPTPNSTSAPPRVAGHQIRIHIIFYLFLILLGDRAGQPALDARAPCTSLCAPYVIESNTVVAYFGALAGVECGHDHGPVAHDEFFLANVDLFIFEYMNELEAVAAKLPNINVHQGIGELLRNQPQVSIVNAQASPARAGVSSSSRPT